jgi:hypothetical protein
MGGSYRSSGQESIAEAFGAEERRWKPRDALERVVARFDCCRVDNLPARAIVALAGAWLAVLDIDDQDEFRTGFSDDTVNDAAGVASA